MLRWSLGAVLLWSALAASAEVLRIGFGTHKPPYVYQGEPRGLEYELVNRAGHLAGFDISAYYAPMERLHLMLQRGEIDGITTTNIGSGVEAFYSDVYIHYRNYAVALAARGYRLNSIEDLGQYSISTFQRARLLLGPEFQRMAERNPRYREEALQINRNRMLYSGRVQVVVADRLIIRHFDRDVAAQVDVTQPLTWYSLFPPTPYRVGFRRDEQRQRFNQGLRLLRESGEYEQIEQRYLVD